MKSMKICVKLLQYLVKVMVLLIQSNLKAYLMIWAVHFLYDGVHIPSAPQLSPVSSEPHL